MRFDAAALLASLFLTLASCGGSASSPAPRRDAANDGAGPGGARGDAADATADDAADASSDGTAREGDASDRDAASDGDTATVAHESPGCGKALATDDIAGMAIAHTVSVTGLADVYQTGGMFAQSSGTFDFSNRPYGVRLPSPYDPTEAYAVSFEGGGCGAAAVSFSPSSQFVLDQTHADIEIALSYVTGCFADGGPVIGNRDDSPEVPYFRAVLADVEARFCVDETRVFVSGTYSGAWEAQLLGCAAADVVRGIATFGGGLRDGRPACKGPIAAFLVTPASSPTVPLGPLPATDPWHVANGSPGLLPERDEILQRNGCVGTTTAPWSAALPACVRFTGCPATSPVVWCDVPGQARDLDLLYASYAPGAMWPFLSTLP